MKKLFVFFVATILSISALRAQHYRGFVDFDISNPLAHQKHLGGQDGLLLGGTTAHGVQLNKLFIGGGGGILFMSDVKKAKIIPLYAAIRYDFFSIRPVNIFISAKIGYKLWLNFYRGAAEGFCGIWGFDFTPSLGVRFRLRPNLGINVGLNFIPVHGNERREIWNEETQQLMIFDNPVFKPRIGASIGIDF